MLGLAVRVLQPLSLPLHHDPPPLVSLPRVSHKPLRTKANLAYMAEIGYYEEVLNAMTNLDLALECDGFVGSIYSNWVR